MAGIQQTVESYIEAGYPFLGLISPEEDRCLELLGRAAQSLRRGLYAWSQTRGWTKNEARINLADESLLAADWSPGQAPDPLTFPVDAAGALLQQARGRRLVLFFKDLAGFLEQPKLVRKLKDLADLRERWTVAFLAGDNQLPALIEKETALVEVPLPDEEELRGLLLNRLKTLEQGASRWQVSRRLVEHVVRATLGLTWRQADLVYPIVSDIPVMLIDEALPGSEAAGR